MARSFYSSLVLASYLLVIPAHAIPPPPPTPPPDSYSENYFLDKYNRMMYRFNEWLFSWINPGENKNETHRGIADHIPAPIKTGTANFLTNLINEPLTIAASLLEGDQDNAFRSTTRLLVNTTIGIGGIFDVAGYFGYTGDYRDLGLAMCRYGIPAGPHVVVPLVGPRTLRDGMADVVLVNVLYLSVLAAIFGSTSSPAFITSVVLMETVGDLSIIRQIDSPEVSEMGDGYEKIRDRYLQMRDFRCRSADPLTGP